MQEYESMLQWEREREARREMSAVVASLLQKGLIITFDVRSTVTKW